jgi:hypothetical protein
LDKRISYGPFFSVSFHLGAVERDFLCYLIAGQGARLFSKSELVFFTTTDLEERQMKKYTYKTVTDPVAIEIDPYWEKVLESEDAQEKLNNRKHNRPDHKYAPCAPLSLESLYCEGAWFVDREDRIAAAEFGE